MLVAEPPLLGGGPETLPVAMVTVPDPEEGQKIGFGVAERSMAGIGLGGFFRGPLPRVADAEGRGDDGDFPEAVFRGRFDQHPGEARIERDPGHPPAAVGQMVVLPALADRAQLDQRLESVLDHPGRRFVDEGKPGRMAEVEVHHPEDDVGQVGAEDLGRSEARPPLVILLVVKPDAQAFGHPAASAFALVGAGFGNRPDRQAVDARAR